MRGAYAQEGYRVSLVTLNTAALFRLDLVSSPMTPLRSLCNIDIIIPVQVNLVASH